MHNTGEGGEWEEGGGGERGERQTNLEEFAISKKSERDPCFFEIFVVLPYATILYATFRPRSNISRRALK